MARVWKSSSNALATSIAARHVVAEGNAERDISNLRTVQTVPLWWHIPNRAYHMPNSMCERVNRRAQPRRFRPMYIIGRPCKECPTYREKQRAATRGKPAAAMGARLARQHQRQLSRDKPAKALPIRAASASPARARTPTSFEERSRRIQSGARPRTAVRSAMISSCILRHRQKACKWSMQFAQHGLLQANASPLLAP